MFAYLTAHWASIVSVLTAVAVVAREITTFLGKGVAQEQAVEAVLIKLGLINDPAAPAAAPVAAPADPAAK